MTEFNKYQTSLEDLHLDELPQEVKEQFFEFLESIPYLKSLASKDRKRAKDLPRKNGRIVVDLEHPHIIENMDYFRPVALHYQKTGRVTDLKPNGNPNSEFMKWFTEEKRRCREGYVRESDGEWITGYNYYFWNYCPMIVMQQVSPNSKKAIRKVSIPSIWEGHYLLFHYIDQAREDGEHAAMLSSRGRGKSYCGAGMLSRNLLLGESSENFTKVVSYIIASDKSYLMGGDQTLDKFMFNISFAAQNTQFPRLKLTDSASKMEWRMGYKDLDTQSEKGTLNSVVGKTLADDLEKMRGSRGALYIIEEFGSFSGLITTYNVLLKSVEENGIAYGQIFAYGTSAEKESDFAAAQELVYNPVGYHIHALKNVYDKAGSGKRLFAFFFPGYMNLGGRYNKDGVSDVTAALLDILLERYKVKYNSSDPSTLIRTIAEVPITPQEAITRIGHSSFPVTDLTERLNQIDNDPSSLSDVAVGELVMDSHGKIQFRPSADLPVRNYPVTGDDKPRGAIEIFKMPEKDANGKVFGERYIAGNDPVDDDNADDSVSLYCTFVMDLWTDTLVAEFTGRRSSDENYEITRLLCLFFNARLLYEAHPLDQVVRTPEGGSKLWGEIKVGDTLFAPNGKLVTVTDIPVIGTDKIYKITLADGRTVEASSHHIWSVYTLTNRNTLQLFTTEEMLQKGVINKHGQKNFFLPDAGCVDYPKTEFPIDPYTLGLLISEGALTKFTLNKKRNRTRTCVQISSSKEDMEFYKTVVPYKIKYIGTKGYSWHMYIDDVQKKLDSLGLTGKGSKEKFIPYSYMYNSQEVRFELLKGLMDGDGCAVKSGASIYVTTSEQLANDVLLLCRSLGIKANFNSSPQGVYIVSIKASVPIFKLPRKVEKQHRYNPHSKGSKAHGFLNRTGISSIEYIGVKPCKCVTVSAENGLYLIGDYVVTHNCNKKGTYAYFAKMNCLYLLADTPDYLRDMDIVKIRGVGNTAKGVNATGPVNKYADDLTDMWLRQPYVKIVTDETGEKQEVSIMNLYRIKSRALLQELIQADGVRNVDRVRALGMVMLYRQEKLILTQGNLMASTDNQMGDDLAQDPFFESNWSEDSWQDNENLFLE